jgi:phosphatidylinositol alpha-1,6-mannosyltransferase
MSLIFLADDFPPAIGGIQTYACELAAAVAGLGESVVAVASQQAGSEAVDRALPCPVVRVPTSGGYAAAALRMAAGAEQAARMMQGPPRCLVATKWSPEGPAAIWAARTLRCPFVLIGHGGEFSTSARQLFKWLVQRVVLRRAALCLANSSHTAERFARARVPAERIEVIYGGVRVERFAEPPPQAVELREQLDLTGKRVVLSVARLVRRKGHDCVLRALPRVAEAVPAVVYLIVGDGPLREELRALAAELGVAEQVRFAGAAPEELLPAYYHVCDVFVMPSRAVRGELVEGFGLAFLEASAAGKPVIGTRFGGIEDAVVDGVSGLLVEPEDPDALAEALMRTLTDEQLARRLGEQGRERVLKEFTWEAVAERFLSALQRVVQPWR